MTLNEWITEALSRHGRTQAELAEAFSRHPSQISRLFKGGRRLQIDEIRIIEKFLGEPVPELWRKIPAAKAQVPVLGYVGAGGLAHFEPIGGEDQIETDAPEGTVAVKIKGTSLGAGFDGWYALYSDRREPLTEDQFGHLCVVGTADGRTLIKWVRRGPGSGVNLMSGTGEIEEDVRLEWAARVIDLKPA